MKLLSKQKILFLYLFCSFFLEFTILKKERKRNEEGTNVPFEKQERGRNEIIFVAKERGRNDCLEKKERPIPWIFQPKILYYQNSYHGESKSTLLSCLLPFFQIFCDATAIRSLKLLFKKDYALLEPRRVNFSIL